GNPSCCASPGTNRPYKTRDQYETATRPRRRLRCRPGGRGGFAGAPVLTRLASPKAVQYETATRPRRRLRCRPGGRAGFAGATVLIRLASPKAGPIRSGDPRVAVSFAESISLSSTVLVDLRLPPTALGLGFVLLALRARRARESRWPWVQAQEVCETKMSQFGDSALAGSPEPLPRAILRPLLARSQDALTPG